MTGVLRIWDNVVEFRGENMHLSTSPYEDGERKFDLSRAVGYVMEFPVRAGYTNIRIERKEGDYRYEPNPV